MDKIAVTIPEAVAMAGIGRTSLYKLFRSGQITPRKNGKRVLVLVEDLKRCIESLPAAEMKPLSWIASVTPRVAMLDLAADASRPGHGVTTAR